MTIKNIYQRLHAVMKQIDYVQKDKKQGMRYSVVSHDKVTALVRQHLHEQGIICYISKLNHQQNGNRTEAHVEVTFANMDDPNDKIVVESLGYGVDDQDKGPGKAISYAVKYAFLKTFCLETGDDPDNHQGSEADHRPGPNHAISKAFSKKNISPLSEPGGPSAYVSRPRYEALYNELGRQTTLRALDAWYDATKGDRDKMAKDFQRQMILEFFAQGFRVAKSADNLMTFWANYERDIEDIKRASQEHYQILYEDYGLALAGFTNNVNAG